MDFRIGAIQDDMRVTGLPVKEAAPKEDLFKSFFDAAVDVVKETNRNIKISDLLQQELALGKTDDIAGVLLASDKANSMLNFTTQITNKIIESYREIMRIQM
ncbi:MAG: flagellar hook-basal body complex protein FliE [Clostridiales bacterium]|jgi:flagellar hook-basal body complex protein FliE|nr:flagellar hook-basal body complex protein FliE [Clostridiales bacterium]